MTNPFRENEPPAIGSTERADATYTAQDAEHLRLLSIFHYVLAAFVGLAGCAPVFHLAFGAIMVVAPGLLEGLGKQPELPIRLVGGMILCVGGCVMLTAWVFAALEVYAGRSLAEQRNHTFCTVIAALNCAWIPLGSVLGVFTLIVLMRPGVKARFQQVHNGSFN